MKYTDCVRLEVSTLHKPSTYILFSCLTASVSREDKNQSMSTRLFNSNGAKPHHNIEANHSSYLLGRRVSATLSPLIQVHYPEELSWQSCIVVPLIESEKGRLVTLNFPLLIFEVRPSFGPSGTGN